MRAGNALPREALLDQTGTLRQRVPGHMDQGVLVGDHVKLWRGESLGGLSGLIMFGDGSGGVRAKVLNLLSGEPKDLADVTIAKVLLGSGRRRGSTEAHQQGGDTQLTPLFRRAFDKGARHLNAVIKRNAIECHDFNGTGTSVLNPGQTPVAKKRLNGGSIHLHVDVVLAEIALLIA